MTHMIEGLIVSLAIAQRISEDHASVPLNAAGVAFIPMTDVLLDRLAARFPASTGQVPSVFSELSPSGVLMA
jgi:hypothetical protein